MILKNTFLTATFSTKGAELISLKTDTEKELIWQADPKFWNKSSPILFPIVGGLKNNRYSYEEKFYELNRHGFARDLEFTVAYHFDEEICFELKSTEDTKTLYPFDFILHIIYSLIHNELLCTYKVINPSKEVLYFSIGAHPAFALGETKEDFEKYTLHFYEDIELECQMLDNGLIGNETRTIVLKNKALPLTYDIFYEDAYVIKNLKSSKLFIRNQADTSEIEFSFDDFPYFGIWSAKDANFICLEPWCGIADSINHNHDLTEKEGIVALASQQMFERNWKIKYKE